MATKSKPDDLLNVFAEDVMRGFYSLDGSEKTLREDIEKLLISKRCPQCGSRCNEKEMHERPITQVRSRMVVTDRMLFCSGICGEHYQMGCEG